MLLRLSQRLLLSSLCLSILACGANQSQPQATQGKFSTGIVGGVEVTEKDSSRSSVVLLVDQNVGFICTGTLIAPQTVLTAGHCLSENKDSLKVVFGLQPLLDEKSDIRDVEAMIRHDDYKKNDYERNDIALVRFQGDLPEGYRFARLGEDADFKSESQFPFLAVGYGRTNGRMNDPDSAATEGSGVLRQVELKALFFDDKKIDFYATQKDGKGVCFGDSGGPALLSNDKENVILGVASGVFHMGDVDSMTTDFDSCTQLSLYMDVRGYRPWIEQKQALLQGARTSSPEGAQQAPEAPVAATLPQID